MGTDEEQSTKKMLEELEVSTQTEEGLTQGNLEDPEAGRRQVRASFEKNLVELDAAIIHVHVQEDMMAKMICTANVERSHGSNQSPILSRLAQVMGQSTREEDLESDVDSDDLSFHETQEEFPMFVDSEWPSYMDSDIEDQKEGKFQSAL